MSPCRKKITKFNGGSCYHALRDSFVPPTSSCSMICPQLSKTGFCVSSPCQFLHPEVCILCDNIQLVTDAVQHLRSNQHLESMFRKGTWNQESCIVCDVVFQGSKHNFIGHYKSPKHTSICIALGLNTAPTLMNHALVHCRPCGILIRHDALRFHAMGPDHYNRLVQLRQAILSDAHQSMVSLIEAEPKNLVYGDLSPTMGKPKTLGFLLSTGTSGLTFKILSVELASTRRHVQSP